MLNVASSVARVPILDVVRGVTPFLIAQLLVLFLLVLFPSLVRVPMEWLR